MDSFYNIRKKTIKVLRNHQNIKIIKNNKKYQNNVKIK
jgi:hypothetical protein